MTFLEQSHTETEEWQWSGAGGGRGGDWAFNECGVSILELDGGDGCPTTEGMECH